ncbi:uncharacterized protein BDCG_04600 [Blastomyces dermatitidis ER-3]|uniref:Uncharacterized protein n=1 Tax=Ajellomyces dermatitidis (strain ER-3 / ATCC MYA-2586) TaxID=559297 RepID=A0ABP2EYZ5_AJEDR|nr:uncharacterized protein BDCG_04600 [Blastomyces dermatitidis ER-3]EEQ89480.2 hypothetical protein BDCG_04600 [Blastomyces dermatitidis ER-3]
MPSPYRRHWTWLSMSARHGNPAAWKDVRLRGSVRVHRKIDALLNKIAAKQDVFRELGAVKRAVAAVSALVVEQRGVPPRTTQTQMQTHTDVFEAEGRRELCGVREDVACCRREVAAVRAVMVNQWVRALSGLIVRIPPRDPACGGGGGGDGSWEDDFPATVRDFWKLGRIEKSMLVLIYMCYFPRLFYMFYCLVFFPPYRSWSGVEIRYPHAPSGILHYPHPVLARLATH